MIHSDDEYEYEYELEDYRQVQTTPKQTEERVYEDPKPQVESSTALEPFQPKQFKMWLQPKDSPIGDPYFHGEVKSGRQEYWLNGWCKVTHYRNNQPGGAVKTKVLYDLDELHTDGRLQNDQQLLGAFAGSISIKDNERLIKLKDHSFIVIPGEPYTLVWYSESSRQAYKLRRNKTELKYEAR